MYPSVSLVFYTNVNIGYRSYITIIKELSGDERSE